ncbi:MAG TPA: glycoside hydrolase family 15 protein [Candidatus Saccharimonadales bacterium]|nr:glycoside hydrolase family 15 protein [Candidatus Saccharimonadales bacterium]
MGRPVVLSNGQLFVGLDESGLVHDFYYPYVGLENLTNARSSQHKIGVWVDGQFKWVDDGSWQTEVDFEIDALISRVRLRSEELKITLLLQDFIDVETNALIRHVTLANDADTEREVRLFMHQVFQISRAGRADTAIYVPDEHYLLDYKGRYSLLIAGKFDDGQDFDQYAVGNYGIEGKAGTYLDAEDGELSGNAVEHGGVDSVLRFSRRLGAGQSTVIDYWIIAASSQSDAQDIHASFKRQNMSDRLRHARQHWQAWLLGGDIKPPDFHSRSLQHSLLIIKAHCDERGSVLASGDSSIFNYGRDYYCYCWPRDAAYALWPLIRLGHFDEARQFLDFARDTMHKDGYLMHKYQPDRAIGSTWHPLIHGRNKELAIQEDETASVVFMIGELYEAQADKTLVENLYRTFVAPAAGFMSRFIDEQTGLPHASYDLWEEKFLTSTYTVCAVIAGLETAAKLAKVVDQPDDAVRWQRAADGIRGNLDKLYHADGYFVKGFLLQDDGTLQYDNTLDISSLYGPYMYAGLPFSDQRLTSTAKHVEERLMNSSPSGGVLRYEHDNYFLTKHQYKGNPWIVSSLWLAQYFASAGQTAKAKRLLEWSLERELPSGALSEQFDPETGAPLGVTPLVWSHAELVNTLLDLSKTLKTKD